MRKLLLTTILVLPLLCGSTIAPKTAITKSNTVYVCTGKSAKKYHKSSRCKGLRNCKGDIVKIERSRAEAMGKTPCRICY